MEQRKIIEPISYFPPPIAPDEVWVPVSPMLRPQPKPEYYVSNYGRLFTTRRDKNIGIMNVYTDRLGYIEVGLMTEPLNANEKTKQHLFRLHRIVKMSFDYQPGCENMEVDHINCNKADNRLYNLDWCDRQENMRRATINGLLVSPRGEDCYNALITNDQARQIAELLLTRKYTHSQIADILGVPLNVVNCISCGKTYIDIVEEYKLNDIKRKQKPDWTDEEVEKICQYFQDNSWKYKKKRALFRAMMKDVFGIEECTINDYVNLYYIFNHQKYKHITCKYTF